MTRFQLEVKTTRDLVVLKAPSQNNPLLLLTLHSPTAIPLSISAAMSARVPLSPRHANWPRNHQHVLGGNKPSPVSILLNEAAVSCKKRKHVADPLPAFEDEVQCPVNAKNIEDLYAPAGSEVVAIPPPKKQKANNKAAVPTQVCPRRPVPKKIKEEARESNAEWRRKYAKIMKSHIFYFDLADGTKCTELMDGVVTAGAVRLPLRLTLVQV